MAAARLLFLDADPSASMPDPTIMDEGLWADSARGIAWFPEGPFADDLGNAYLVAPLYTWLLSGIYAVFGVGLWQTRLLSALASIATAALGGRIVGARHGHGAAALTTMLLGICPLLDQHGRFALLESTQSFWLLASFALLFPRRPGPAKALLAGAAMAAAILVKPNAATYGVLPFALAFAVAWHAEWRAGGGPGVHRARCVQAIACVLGGAATLAAIGLPIWLAHWQEFTATIEHESGGANWTLADHLLRLGVVGSREQSPGHHRLWALLRHAPLCTVGVWLLLLRRAHGHPLPDWHGTRALWVWLIVGTLVQETSYDHVARRQVLLLPAMAMLCATAWAQRRVAPAAVPRWPLWSRWLLLLSLPVLLLKPAAANALAGVLRSANVPAANGETGLLGGWIVLLALVAAPTLLTVVKVPPDGLIRSLLRWAGLAIGLAMGQEVSSLGALPPHAHTIRAAQDRLEALVEPGEIVLGEHAATMLQRKHVRTVRRVLAGAQYSSPRPNPDVAERLRPRYVLDYAAPELREFADVTASGFDPIGEVGFLIEPSGKPRFELRLWRRR